MSVLYTYSVPTFALDIIGERVEKINRRAIKRGFPTVSTATGPTKLVPDPYFDHLCDSRVGCDENIPTVEYTEVTISASDSLKMAGWRLIGVVAADAVDQNGHVVPMVTNVPGETFDGTIADAQLCQHCNTRRYRTETFILRHDDGREMQVGRQCIRDFLGHDPAALLAGLDAFRSLMISDDERESWGRSAPSVWSVDDVIMAGARIVAVTGFYVSRLKAEESALLDRPLISTASDAFRLLTPARTEYDRDFVTEHPISETAQRIFDNTKDALANLKPSNEWEDKLASYANIAQVGARHVGTLVSSVILGMRLEERKAKAAARPESRHFGTVGQRVTVEATVLFTKEFDGNYGTTTLIKFSTPDGDAQWWRSGALYGPDAETFAIGQTVTLTGSVKAHELDRFDSRPITVLTRCKVQA